MSTSASALTHAYDEVRPGYLVEPSCCVHTIAGNQKACPDCGLSGAGRVKERELRSQGWSVNDIVDLELM